MEHCGHGGFPGDQGLQGDVGSAQHPQDGGILVELLGNHLGLLGCGFLRGGGSKRWSGASSGCRDTPPTPPTFTESLRFTKSFLSFSFSFLSFSFSFLLFLFFSSLSLFAFLSPLPFLEGLGLGGGDTRCQERIWGWSRGSAFALGLAELRCRGAGVQGAHLLLHDRDGGPRQQEGLEGHQPLDGVLHLVVVGDDVLEGLVGGAEEHCPAGRQDRVGSAGREPEGHSLSPAATHRVESEPQNCVNVPLRGAGPRVPESSDCSPGAERTYWGPSLGAPCLEGPAQLRSPR